jgi:hypothetical protein
MAHFVLVTEDQHYYLLTADWVFAYWPGSFASSPSHSIMLRFVEDWKGGGYHLALDKMLRPAPTPEEWKKFLREVEEALAEGGPPSHNLAPTLWNTVLDLIYTGHSDLAWKFLDDAGPSVRQGDNLDLSDFCSVLKISHYWPDLEKTIQNAPPACANAKPDSRFRCCRIK